MTECLWCDNEATSLCDAALGCRAAAGMGGKWVYEKEVFTCDAPMCSKHSKVAGHICGGKDGCELIEHCPTCAAEDFKLQPMFQHEAERVRRDRHAMARRAKLRLAHS